LSTINDGLAGSQAPPGQRSISLTDRKRTKESQCGLRGDDADEKLDIATIEAAPASAAIGLSGFAPNSRSEN
jgi:hypothetical protein